MTELEDRLTTAFASWAGGTPPLNRVQDFIKELEPVGLELGVVAAIAPPDDPELDDPQEVEE